MERPNVMRLGAREADRKLALAIDSLMAGTVRAVVLTRHGFAVAAVVALSDVPSDVRPALGDGGSEAAERLSLRRDLADPAPADQAKSPADPDAQTARGEGDAPHTIGSSDPVQRRRFMQKHPCPGGPDAGSTRRCH